MMEYPHPLPLPCPSNLFNPLQSATPNSAHAFELNIPVGLSQLACHLVSRKPLAKKASNIPFIHNFPSPVRLGIAVGYQRRDNVYIQDGIQGSRVMVYRLTVEAGECHIFLAMKRKISSGHEWKNAASEVFLAGGVVVTRGIS